MQTRAAGHPELVGLCSVLRELLADVQLPDFRCCSHIEAPLSHWFGSRRVAAYLQAGSPPLSLERPPSKNFLGMKVDSAWALMAPQYPVNILRFSVQEHLTSSHRQLQYFFVV